MSSRTLRRVYLTWESGEETKDALRIQRVLVVQNVRRICPWKFRWTGVA